MKEKKLRKDGKLKEAADMFKNLLKNDEGMHTEADFFSFQKFLLTMLSPW